jgi:hypothetical protein
MRFLPAFTFLVGLLLGAVVIGVGIGGDDDAEETSPTPSASAGSTTTADSPGPSDTAVIVPAACSQASQEVTDAVELLREGAQYVQSFQPKRLLEVLNQLETLDADLREQAQECADGVTTIPTDTTEPTPTESTSQ